MTESNSTTRRADILDAAGMVFLRYGFKKTSMDDLARAAGLSRQGLYLHFPNKEALFEAMVVRSMGELKRNAQEALAQADVGIADRLLNAFQAMHGGAVGSDALDELIATTAAMVGPMMTELEDSFVADVMQAMEDADVGQGWASEGISVQSLAEHLSASSVGIKHKAKSPGEYRERMQVAVQLVCRRLRS
ncbi:TetR/AcrR family transcriptional regulator [Pseudomonas sp. B21-056]|uniref:TetR/AcrR family transcriptional regulator n=1 Tax=Pseudomonas sp. B21-056 TaxID=2895495 RepID=UPI00222E162E|nr:TetR/AcrR family transcriptional regulator [Pseudomonas sp. B21-056]UZE24782.1 TetR/AcrR family transcriptional regulator [Pseudomonas sp. B21-056]